MGYGGNGISSIYKLAYKDGTSHTDVLVLGRAKKPFLGDFGITVHRTLAAIDNYIDNAAHFKILSVHKIEYLKCWEKPAYPHERAGKINKNKPKKTKPMSNKSNILLVLTLNVPRKVYNGGGYDNERQAAEFNLCPIP